MDINDLASRGRRWWSSSEGGGGGLVVGGVCGLVLKAFVCVIILYRSDHSSL
jgi:hypothetical protein